MKERVVTRPDGSSVYVTIEGDMVDLIAYGLFGKHATYSEEILEANPGLAELGPVFPAGLVIRLPSETRGAPAPFRQLWD